VQNFWNGPRTIRFPRKVHFHLLFCAGTLQPVNASIAVSEAPPESAPPQPVTPVPEVTPTTLPHYYLGDLMAGTYCSRLFTDCDRKACRLQSPNFPGIYPRNLTCYYAVRQHEVPEGKQALIAVRQPKRQLVSIRSQSSLYGPSSQQQQQQHRSRELKVWEAWEHSSTLS
jgi:hypothetical protein